jgi:hypothetical protein
VSIPPADYSTWKAAARYKIILGTSTVCFTIATEKVLKLSKNSRQSGFRSEFARQFSLYVSTFDWQVELGHMYVRYVSLTASSVSTENI